MMIATAGACDSRALIERRSKVESAFELLLTRREGMEWKSCNFGTEKSFEKGWGALNCLREFAFHWLET